MSFIFNQIVHFVTPVFRSILVTWALTSLKAIKKSFWRLGSFGYKIAAPLRASNVNYYDSSRSIVFSGLHIGGVISLLFLRRNQ